jgi:hypothetical protein
MKKLVLAICILTGLLLANMANAQVSVNVNVDIQPNWGPTGYDKVVYYYIPDIEVYYYVPRQQFVYFDGGHWIFAASLPGRCRSYDLYRGYKVVINEYRPYLHHDVYRGRYSRYRDCYDHQVVLRDKRKGNWDDENDGPGNHGKGHAYGHYKNDKGHGKKDQDD